MFSLHYEHYRNHLTAKSLHESLAERHFYGTETEIWADFGPVSSTEKKFGPIMSNFWGDFLTGKKYFKKTVKSCKN